MIIVIAAVIGATIASAGARDSASGLSAAQIRGEAEARIARTELGGGLEAALGNSFAGLWFDPATAQLHVGVTSAASRQIVEAVSARAGLTDLVTMTNVASTWRQLETAQENLNDGLEDLFARGVVRTALDPERNLVEVELGSAVPAARRGVLSLQAAGLGVEVAISVASTPLLVRQAEARCKEFEKGSDNANCDKPIVAGVTIESESVPSKICTAGPPAILQDLSTAEKVTTTYLLTAGHCIAETGGAGTKWNAFTKEKGKKGVAKLIGKAEQGLKGEKGPAGDRVDVGFIKIENPGNWVHEGGAAATPVTPGVAPWDATKEVEPFAIVAQGPTEPAKGTEVCLSGQSSGNTCAKVLKPTVTETFENKAGEKWTVDKTVEVEEGKSEPGDSGGPWYLKAEPGKVLGTHIGSAGGLANYQPLAVSFANLETKLQLLTTANEKRVHPGPITKGGTSETLPKETKITATSTNTVVKTSIGTLTCALIAANGELTENIGQSATLVPTGAATTTTCKFGSTPITVTDFTGSLHWSASSDRLDLTFIADLPSSITCHYKGSLPITYTAGSDVISVKGGAMTASPAICGTATLTGDFTLELTAGGSVAID